MKIYILVLAVIFSCLLSLNSCAKRGTITGGAKDTIPPVMTYAVPKNFSTNFNKKEIKIGFNELVEIKNSTKQLIISPPLQHQPIIIPRGRASKYISIKIKDTLQPNTTYSFNFGQSIVDYNEGNPYNQYKYVFSTGNYIDSLTVVGIIKDAFDETPDSFVSVQLYDSETFTDSTIYKEKPLYITNTLDSAKVFAIENLKKGSYYLVALKDDNGNYTFDPKTDKIGFVKTKITLPTDSIFTVRLFNETPAFTVKKPIQQTKNKFFMGIKNPSKNITVTAKTATNNIPVVLTCFPKKNTDSVQLFIPVLAPKEQITFTIKNDTITKEFTSSIKNKKTTDSLVLQPVQNEILSFREKYAITTLTPLKKIDTTKISIVKNDSTSVDFSLNYNMYKQKVTFDFEKEENKKYTIKLLPEAVTDMYKSVNDTLTFTASTKAFSDYGNLQVQLQSIKTFPIILQLILTNEVVASFISKGEKTVSFNAIKPGTYTLRVIYDTNNNGKWDTGNFLLKKQPEKVIYLPKKVEIRANWEVEQAF